MIYLAIKVFFVLLASAGVSILFAQLLFGNRRGVNDRLSERSE